MANIGEDLELIHQALRNWGRFAYENRWGGLSEEWEKCKQAIEALERIKIVLGDQQLELPGLGGGENAQCNKMPAREDFVHR